MKEEPIAEVPSAIGSVNTTPAGAILSSADVWLEKVHLSTSTQSFGLHSQSRFFDLGLGRPDDVLVGNSIIERL